MTSLSSERLNPQCFWSYNLTATVAALVYETLYDKVFGFSKTEMDSTVFNVRNKRYNHGSNGSMKITGSPTSTSGSSGDEQVPSQRADVWCCVR